MPDTSWINIQNQILFFITFKLKGYGIMILQHTIDILVLSILLLVHKGWLYPI